MPTADGVLEYKCPCCDAALRFGGSEQMMTCEYCGNSFEIDSVLVYNEVVQEPAQTDVTFDQSDSGEFTEEEAQTVVTFSCPSCGGQIITEEHTAATFCPYCESPTILTGRISGELKPDGVIPFKTTKQDAEAAFLQLCKGKRLLPRAFTKDHRVEKISGIYVPFWLYDCDGSFSGTYRGTRIHTWSDFHYYYTKTDHYLLKRSASAGFGKIPMDASTKIDNSIMESIEPFDYSQMVYFETAYLSGFLADKYDVEASAGQSRVRERVHATMKQMVQSTLVGYSGITVSGEQLNIQEAKAHYVLLPVWMLHTKYKDKTYVFAMNGQTGKMTGSFPICPKRSFAWFAGIFAAVTAAAMLVQTMIFG